MNTASERRPHPANKNRPLLIIIAVALITTVVPYLMYYTGLGIPDTTTNEGILVSEPVLLEDFTFYDDSGEAWHLAEQTPKFRLVIPVRGECDEACRQSLYLTRQVDIRLAENGEQLERVFLQLGEDGNEAFKQFLAEEHPELIYLQGDYREWQAALGERPELSAELTGAEYYLLHRYGALAMAYNEQHSGNQLLDDLNFLISTSN